MIILSVHDGHDAGACLLRDGKVVLYSAEERRRNVKNYAGIPAQSLRIRPSDGRPLSADFVARTPEITAHLESATDLG